MAENGPERDPGAEDARLTSLDERLRQAHRDEAARGVKGRATSDGGYSLGNRVLADLIGGLVGGGLAGWLLDRWLGTSPWLLLVLLFLGMVGAFWNIVRMSNGRPE